MTTTKLEACRPRNFYAFVPSLYRPSLIMLIIHKVNRVHIPEKYTILKA